MRIRSFLPIADGNARVLILGTMPSEASLRKNEYYGHPRNGFWPIMTRLLGLDPAASYVERSAALGRNRIALWDVIGSCEREGSRDSDIRAESIKVNNLAGFHRKHPCIECVCFNGARAEQEYVERVLPSLSGHAKDIVRKRLPSTSPAMASQGFEEKLRAWACVKG